MWKKVLAVVIGITAMQFTAVTQAGEGASGASRFGRANDHEISAYIMLIRLRGDLLIKWKETGKWPDDPNANRALEAHNEYWREQLGAGRAILGGGMNGDFWDNVALIIFEAKSQAEAKRIAHNDPAVKAYVFQAQVRPFDVHFITDKYSVGQD